MLHNYIIISYPPFLYIMDRPKDKIDPNKGNRAMADDATPTVVKLLLITLRNL